MNLLRLVNLWPPFEASQPNVSTPPTIPGVEYTASAARPQFQALGNKRPHYTASGGRPHYEAVEE